MTTVDVIIPVHSAKRPIARCVSSALKNNLPGLRVVVVSHNTPKADVEGALGMIARNERVSLYELTDGLNGPSSPKNFGLSVSEADYVSFVDSDDTLDPGTLDRWVKIAQEDHADFVIANREEPGGENAPSPPVRI